MSLPSSAVAITPPVTLSHVKVLSSPGAPTVSATQFVPSGVIVLSSPMETAWVTSTVSASTSSNATMLVSPPLAAKTTLPDRSTLSDAANAPGAAASSANAARIVASAHPRRRVG